VLSAGMPPSFAAVVPTRSATRPPKTLSEKPTRSGSSEAEKACSTRNPASHSSWAWLWVASGATAASRDSGADLVGATVEGDPQDGHHGEYPEAPHQRPILPPSNRVRGRWILRSSRQGLLGGIMVAVEEGGPPCSKSGSERR
jgi:hypothetical protein